MTRCYWHWLWCGDLLRMMMMVMMVVLVFFQRLQSGSLGFVVMMMVVMMGRWHSSGCDQRWYCIVCIQYGNHNVGSVRCGQLNGRGILSG